MMGSAAASQPEWGATTGAVCSIIRSRSCGFTLGVEFETFTPEAGERRVQHSYVMARDVSPIGARVHGDAACARA
jgi:hypothetical protein